MSCIKNTLGIFVFFHLPPKQQKYTIFYQFNTKHSIMHFMLDTPLKLEVIQLDTLYINPICIVFSSG